MEILIEQIGGSLIDILFGTGCLSFLAAIFVFLTSF